MTSRWTDNPFGEPTNRRGVPVKRRGLPVYTPEQWERLNKINEAYRIYRETGDNSQLVEVGLNPGLGES